MSNKKEKFPKFLIRANVVPDSVNEEERTIEVQFGTEQLVKRYHWSRGWYMEQLSFNPSHVDMKRLESGSAQFLDNHNYWGSVRGSVLGVICSAEIRDGKGYAIVKISKRSKEMDEVWIDIKDGITKNVSVGYNVRTYEITENEGGLDTYRATDWEPMEISLVTIPADSDAYIRAATSDEAPVQVINIISKSKNPNMDKNQKNQIRSLVTNAGLPESFAEGLIGRKVSLSVANTEIAAEVAKRSKTPTPEPTPAPVAEPVKRADDVNIDEAVKKATAEAITLERTRTATIVDMVRTANLEDDFATELVNKGISAEAAKTQSPHRVMPGNRPSNFLTLDTLDPYHLGALIALYEHRTYVQSVIWGVNAFDQWGVELGKKLGKSHQLIQRRPS